MTIHEQDLHPCPVHDQDLVPCPVHSLDVGSEPAEDDDDPHYWLVEQEIRKEFTVFTVEERA